MDEETLEDPVIFFTYATSFPPYFYQAEFLKMKDKRIAMNWGRQSGKSLAVAIRALWQAFTYSDQIILILAPTLRQSNIIFRYVKFYAENKNFILEHITRNTTTEMWFDNGSQIYCLPSGKQSGDNIRGYAARLIIIDEAAYVEEDAFLAIEPSLAATDGGLILISTPRGRSGFYYEAFAPNSEYKTMHIKSEQCPGIKKEFLEKRRSQLTENEYKQEYEAEFTSEANTYFRLDQIKDAMIIEKEIEKAEEDCKYDFGVDVARMGEDETVLIIVDKTNKKMVKIDTYSKKPTTEIIDMIKYWYDRFVPESINVDSASMGAGVCDILLKEQYPIKMIDLNRTSEKEAIYENLKLLLERRMIKLLKDYKLEDQLKDIISTFTQMGRHISASSDRRHEDRVDGLCLACSNIKPVEDETDEFFGASG